MREHPRGETLTRPEPPDEGAREPSLPPPAVPGERHDQETEQRGTRIGWRLAVVVALVAVALVLVVLTLGFGSANVPLADVSRAVFGEPTSDPRWSFIVRELRMPRALTAAVGGAAIAVAGLVMQTLFRNALADPYLLGVSSGASLGVAVVILGASGAAGPVLSQITAIQGIGVVASAAVGAMAVMALMLVVASAVRNIVIVIIMGIMLNAFVTAFVSMLVYFADPDAVKAFTDWGAGSFQGVTWGDMPMLVVMVAVGLAITGLLVKHLNVFLLGESYASSLGLSVVRFRWTAMVGASLLAGVITAYAGPIGFLGIAGPHLARGLLRTADHRWLVPGSIMTGATVALAAGLLAELPGSELVLPVNATLALIGAPVVAWVLIRLARSGRGMTV